VCLLPNIHDPPREGNYHDEHGNAIKPAIVADYNRHMGHVDNADRMANSYTASRRTWKWTKKTLFPSVRPGRCQQLHPLIFRDFQLTLIREMLARSGHEPRPSMPVGRPASSSYNTERLDTHHNKHWPGHSNMKRRSHVFFGGHEANGDIQMCQV